MKKYLTLLMMLAMTLGLAACSGKKLPTETNNQETVTKEPSNTETPSAGEKNLNLTDTLKINYAVGNNQRTLTYNQSTPLTMPDGKVVVQGDLKPMWQYVSEQLGFQLQDVAVQDQKAEEMIQIAAATSFTDATVYGGAQGQVYMQYGTQGYLLDLNKRLDDMPDFKAYIEKYPNIKSSITASDGGIYYIPYVAEIGNYARGFHGRQTWISGLLDSDASLESETKTLKVAYEGYWDRNDTNVIALQNAAAKNGTLTRDEALRTLLDYIKATYPDLAKPSDLYLGVNAQYDIDELIALWRVMELSPRTLSKLSTGKVVEDAEISPYFVRQSSYREDLLRLSAYFGGQRTHGADSYGSRFYLNKDGELTFSYAEDGMIDVYDYLRQIYSEGLIHTEFADLNNKDNFRSALYSSDDNEGQRQFGFMIFDWFASTTAANDDVVAMLPPVTQVGSEDFIHFIENTRTIKPEGWAISSDASEEEINAALQLFNYFFTEEGNIVQNYGVPSMIVDNEKYLGPDGIEYPKFDKWIFETAGTFTNGDVSAFLRDFVGSQMPIGYQKEIGFEYQYTNESGLAAWNLYNKAQVKTTSYEASEPLYKIVPTVFSLTEQDMAKLSNISISEIQVDQIFLYITGSDIAVKKAEEIKEFYLEAGLDEYVKIYQDAYKRMTE